MMEMMMCRSCGEFTLASLEDGTRVPMEDECRQCGGVEFRDLHGDRTWEAVDED